MGRRSRNVQKGRNEFPATEIQNNGDVTEDIDTDTKIHKCRNSATRPGPKCLDQSLERLYEKRGSTRETALSSIISCFCLSYQYQFAGKNFFALLCQCLNSFKKGSTKESCLALEALGLLAITIGCGDNSHELYRESVPVLAQALNTESQPSKLKLILDSLAIITFVGGNELDETERSMQSIWHFMHTRSDLKEAQSAAVSAWSLLLSTVDGWTLSHKHWRGAIPFFKNLLDAAGETTSGEASQALALILELGCLEKFEGDTSLANEEMHIGKDEYVPEGIVKIGRQRLKVTTLPQQLQLNFLKRLLGAGFVEHMRANEFLHNVFNFEAEKRQLDRELYVAERDEVAVNLYVHDIKRESSYQRLHKSPNSTLEKVRTRIRNKNRDIRGEELWSSTD